MTLTTPNRRRRLIAGSSAGLLAVAGVVATAAPAVADSHCDTAEALVECVTVEGVEDHLRAFQGIADANGGNRASGTPGYDASADYVVQRLEDAGYTVQRQEFDFAYYELVGEPTFTVGGTPWEYGTQYQDMSYSGSGDLVATGVAVADVGCAAGDYAGVEGQIAIISRGTCTFGEKAAFAEAAGALGAVIYNNDAENPDALIGGTLGGQVGIPVLDTSLNAGPGLVGQQLAISIETVSGTRTTENVIAELPGRKKHDVVMVGAHLDSVAEGPGINDNGTGSAGILEVAEELAGTTPAHPVRFAWWGAEESGLIGSQHYVDSLPPNEINRISAYLNFDMIGSPNFARFVYDGDGDTFEAPEGFVTPESAAIEHLFEEFYDARGLAHEDTEFDGRSDYEAFALAGIPSGGLFTGAEGVKTPEQVDLYGGTAGEWYDPCYHQSCDTIANYDATVLHQNADAIAYAVLTLAGQHDSNRGGGNGNGHGGGHGGHGQR